MHLDEAIRLFMDHRRRRTIETRQHYQHWLTEWRDWRIAHTLPNEIVAVQIEDFRGFVRYLEDEHIPHSSNPHRPPVNRHGLMPASVGAAYRTLRSFWIFLDNEELLTPQQARFFTNNRIPVPEVIESPRPYCDEQDLAQLLAACGDGFDEESARNRAIILLLYESGMRIGELCALEDPYVHLRERQALVLGKGNRWRPVFWLPPGAVVLIRYVLLRRGPRDRGALFRGTSLRNNGGPMTTDAIRSMIKRIADDADIELPHGCPLHWFRHSFAKRALEAGLDLAQVSQLLGHRNPKTTARYVQEYPVRLKALYDGAFCPTVTQQRVPSHIYVRT
jgi:site-specific recombinase XerD